MHWFGSKRSSPKTKKKSKDSFIDETMRKLNLKGQANIKDDSRRYSIDSGSDGSGAWSETRSPRTPHPLPCAPSSLKQALHTNSHDSHLLPLPAPTTLSSSALPSQVTASAAEKDADFDFDVGCGSTSSDGSQENSFPHEFNTCQFKISNINIPRRNGSNDVQHHVSRDASSCLSPRYAKAGAMHANSYNTSSPVTVRNFPVSPVGNRSGVDTHNAMSYRKNIPSQVDSPAPPARSPRATKNSFSKQPGLRSPEHSPAPLSPRRRSVALSSNMPSLPASPLHAKSVPSSPLHSKASAGFWGTEHIYNRYAGEAHPLPPPPSSVDLHYSKSERSHNVQNGWHDGQTPMCFPWGEHVSTNPEYEEFDRTPIQLTENERSAFPPSTSNDPLSPGTPSIPRSPDINADFRTGWRKGAPLGSGTFGQVFMGFHSATGQSCAIKEVLIIPDNDKSKESAKQLEQEVTMLSRMKHPNIVQYYGSEMVEDRLFIYLEFMSNGSIHKIIQQYGPLNESCIQVYTRQILEGLSYLHGKNCVHRDIKGANILVDKGGEVKLADFGMAKHVSKQSLILSMKGSPYWMAPEVIRNTNGYDFAVDIWSLGCTVLEMATGKPPWSHFEGIAVVYKIGSSKEIPAIPDFLSDDAKGFLRSCLQRDPKRRPKAKELLDHPFVRGV